MIIFCTENIDIYSGEKAAKEIFMHNITNIFEKVMF